MTTLCCASKSSRIEVATILPKSSDLVFVRHVAMRCFYGVIQWVYVNDPPHRCSRCRAQCPSFNFLDDTVPPFGPAGSFVDVSTAC
ncbi:hypothetical protein HPB50_015853 [Hyalomma asiaticum]|uniref:Uncharacterized protein n=1 Tax=Hyalomma asiaticum TaxID=266040 RepID=A0ACB7RUN3_HYAAI|nr:hypothetical protein HPB50_015853 [Hyalomma asiaticum]